MHVYFPVSFATFFWRIAITPNSHLPKKRPRADWIEVNPDPGQNPA
jgi:hypothetical protein